MQFTQARPAPALFVVMSLLLLSPAALGQDQTAADLLDQAVEQYQAGQYEQAQQTLERVDRVQLDEQQQRTFERTQAQVQGYLEAADRLDQARELEDQGQLEAARDLYRQVTVDTAAPRRLRTAAIAGLDRVQRRISGVDVPAPAPTVADPDDAPPPTQTSLNQAMRLRAEELVAQGDQAFNTGDFDEAQALYQRALQLDPNNQRAAEQLEQATARLEAGADGGGILRVEAARENLLRQQTIARYNLRMEEAQKAMAQSNWDKAADAAGVAKSIVDLNAQHLGAQERQQMRQAAIDLAAQAADEGERLDLEEARAEAMTRDEQMAAERERAERQRMEQVNELLQRAAELSREQRYDQALEVVEQVLFMDETNVSAKFMRDMITEQMLSVRYQELQRQRQYEMARQRLDLMADTIPHRELITYPPDWPELTRRRLGAQEVGAETEADRVARERMQQPIPVDFSGNQLENVIGYLRTVTGANIFVQWNVLENAGVFRDTQITMNLTNVAAQKALDLILDEAGGQTARLGYTIEDGVVIVATEEFLTRKTVLRTYDIRDLLVQIPTFDQAPEFDLNALSSDTGDGGGGGGSIFEDLDDDASDNVPRSQRIADIRDLIQNTINPNSWQDFGGPGSIEELNGTLIVSTTEDSHVQIASLLRSLRQEKSLQINVESRFLFVTQNFLEDVGIDVDITLDEDYNWLAGDPTIQQSSFDTAAAGTTPVEGSLGGDDAVAGLLFGAATGAGVGSLGFLIDDLRVDVLIRATQRDVRNVTVNTPRLTFFNGSRAYVNISRQVAFVSDLEPVVGTGSTAFDPEVNVVQDGVVLDVEGTISADRRYVTLIVQPSLAQLTTIRRFSVFADVDEDADDDDDDAADDDDDDDDDGDDGADTSSGFIQQPEISLTALKTAVSVPDKGTLLLGGQRLVGEIEKESGVPVLSKIPIINRLFTNRSKVRDEKTLLILIKPTIIIQGEEEEKLFPGLMQAPGLYAD